MSFLTKIKEKPLKYLSILVSISLFVSEIIEAIVFHGMFIYKHGSQLESFLGSIVGPIAYWVLQIGLPMMMAGAVAVFGFIVTVSVWFFFDECYKSQFQTIIKP